MITSIAFGDTGVSGTAWNIGTYIYTLERCTLIEAVQYPRSNLIHIGRQDDHNATWSVYIKNLSYSFLFLSPIFQLWNRPKSMFT